jgi:hypothetical protein
MNQLKKITAKHLNLAPVLAQFKKTADDGEIKQLYTIVGQVTGYRSDTGTYGEWVMFTGSFVATLKETGEIFSAPQAGLPGFITDQLVPLVKQANGQAVEFAFDVSVKRREDLGIGYEYLVKSLIEQQISDPMAALLARAGVTVPQLAAPAPTASEQPARSSDRTTGQRNRNKEQEEVNTLHP